eukprot:107680-Amorphochlora_amoeboformis.AAC.1
MEERKSKGREGRGWNAHVNARPRSMSSDRRNILLETPEFQKNPGDYRSKQDILSRTPSESFHHGPLHVRRS